MVSRESVILFLVFSKLSNVDYTVFGKQPSDFCKTLLPIPVTKKKTLTRSEPPNGTGHINLGVPGFPAVAFIENCWDRAVNKDT
jgi:hypothetical protein